MTETDVSLGVTDRSLRAVVAVVEAGSFTGAALTLGIGQSAVSHAVARLEQALGVALFIRKRDGVEPTTVGAALAARAAPALRELDAAVSAAAQPLGGGAVTISVSTSLAAYWLTPRLPEFKQAHPDVELRVLTTDTDTGVGRDGADLWIPLGPVDDPALDSVPFCAERLIPVAAPGLAAAIDIADPAALLDSPLLHLEERYVPRFDWPRWFRHHGVAVDGDVPGDRSNDYSLVLLRSPGPVWRSGGKHIVRELLGQGRLVAVGPVVETGIHFPLLSRHGRPLSPAAETLRTWILANAPG